MKYNYLKEFKEFALKGNVIDLAVGVIVGGALNKIIGSIVNDILLPLAGIISGGINFRDLKWSIKSFTDSTLIINYGIFLQNIIEFLIIAWVVFIVVKIINRLHRKKQAEMPVSTPPPSKEEQLLTEIRDLLKASKISQ
jgi:large conductance mechanosensitive channel